MKEIIAVINQKGGVGKSTTALALGAGLQRKGFSVLFIDLDAQGNLSYSLGAKESGLTAEELLLKTAGPGEIIQHTEQGDLIPYSPALAGLDTILTETGKEYRLNIALQTIKDSYEYIIIDTPPALSILTVISITAATGIIIPAQADIYSLQGISQLYNTIRTIKQHTNPGLIIKGILLTRYNPRTILSRDIAEAIGKITEQMGTRLFKTTIRECIAIKEAQISQRDIFSYAPGSNASKDYSAFIEELLSGGRDNG